jgi:hypothetical protein
MKKRFFLLLWAFCMLSTTGCTANRVLDFAMATAPHSSSTTKIGPYEVLSGDLHCHVMPPDADYHVSRELTDTIRIANEEHLDFVVLTPHVPSRFFLNPEKREWVRATQSVLRARVALEGPEAASKLIVIPGMEYTDHRYGHVGLSFANVDEVLDELTPDELRQDPARFFERWQAHGGLTTINHPVLRGIPRAPIVDLRYDLSWRGFRRANDASLPLWLPFVSEVDWLTRHATAVETHNLSVGHLVDQFWVGDPDWTLREATHLVDREARLQKRRITPVGGSDSHGMWLRPTTWLLASERSVAGIRDAIVHGRTCVRGPEACLLEVRGGDGAFHTVGASIAASNHYVDARVGQTPSADKDNLATFFVNGTIAGEGRLGDLVRLATPRDGHCSIVRASVGRSMSAPVYVDCPWAALASSR